MKLNRLPPPPLVHQKTFLFFLRYAYLESEWSKKYDFERKIRNKTDDARFMTEYDRGLML